MRKACTDACHDNAHSYNLTEAACMECGVAEA